MLDFDKQPNSDRKELVSANEMPAWSKPTITVLDVESGTLTTSGPNPDGNGSTS